MQATVIFIGEMCIYLLVGVAIDYTKVFEKKPWADILCNMLIAMPLMEAFSRFMEGK